MDAGKELQFLLNMKLMVQGNAEFEKAAASCSKLQKETKNLKDASDQINKYSAKQEDVAKAAQRLDEQRAAYERNTAAINQSRGAQETARVSLDANKLKLGEINATLKENVANYQAQQLTVNAAGLNYQNVTAQGAQVTGEIAQRLEDARQKLSALGETLPRTSAEYRVQASEVRKLEAEYATATAQSKAQSAEALSRYKAEQAKLKELSQTVSKSSAAYKAQQAVVKKLQTEYKQSVNETRQFEAEQKRLAASVSKAEEKLSDEQTAAGKLADELRKANVDTKNLASEQERLSAAIKKSGDVQKNYREIREKLTWQNFSGDLMSAYASAKTLQVPIKIDMEFEQAMANVRAVLGDSINAEEFQEMRSESMRLGATTQFSSTQAAATQETLARANFSKQDISNMLEPLMAMSAAEGMDLNEGANILAGALRGFSAKTSDAAKYADILAYTSKASNTSISKVGEAFTAAAATAAKQNVTAEKLSSYIGTFANQNIQGSEAGVAISNALMSLSAPAAEGREMLNKLKVRTQTRGGDLVELPEVLKQIEAATASLGNTGRAEAYKKIFGKVGARAMMTFSTGIMSGDQEKLEKGLYDERNGTAAAMAKIRNDTLKGDIVSLGSAWEGLMINIGQALEPINRFVTQTLTTGIQKVNEFMTEHKTLASAITYIGAGLASWKVLSTVYTYGSLLVRLPFAKIAVSLAAGQAQAAAAGASMQATGGIFASVFGMIKTAAISTWGIIAAHPFVAIGAAVAAAAVLIYQNWDKIKEKFSVVADYCREKWQALSDWWNSWEFPNIFSGLGELFSNALEGLKNIWGSFVDWLSGLNPFKKWGEAANAGIKTAVSHLPDKQVDNAAIALNSWGIPGYATGGIIDKPSVIQVAESGREAIIPLTDKSRGVPLLMQAARELGVVNGTENFSRGNLFGEVNKKVFSGANQNFSQNFSGGVSTSSARVLNSVRNFFTGNTSNMTQNLTGEQAQNFGVGVRPNDTLTQNFSPSNEIISRENNLFSMMENVLERKSDLEIASNNYSLLGGNNNGLSNRGAFSPVINIQVDGGSESNTLADDIARKVREVLAEISSYQERVAYA